MNQLQVEATQLVRAFLLKYDAENLDEARLVGTVYLGLKDGLNAVSIRHALPRMRTPTMSALRACVAIVEADSQQPEEQRTRRPRPFVAPPPVERTPDEVAAAQLAFGEMRAMLSEGEGTRTSPHHRERRGGGAGDPPSVPPPPLGR